MWIIIVLIIIVFFWLGGQNEKAKPDYQKESTFVFNYVFPFSKPYEAEPISTSFIINGNTIVVRDLHDKKSMYFSITKVVNDSFSKNYHCVNKYGDLVLVYFFRDGARVQDYGTGFDMKFTKYYPDNKHYST